MGTSNDYLPIDWYKGYFYGVLNAKKNDGTDYVAVDIIALTSDSASLLNGLKFESDSRQIYHVTNLNYSTTIKNILEITDNYGKTVGQMFSFYPNLVDGVDLSKYATDTTAPNPLLSDNAAYNENYSKRVALTKSGDIHIVIGLKNIEFFASLKGILLPPTKVNIYVTIEADNILIHKKSTTDVGKITIKNLWLCYEKLILGVSDKVKSVKFLSEPKAIKFYQESIKSYTSLKNRERTIVLYETSKKLRDLFIFVSHTENRNPQNNDSFAINTSDMKIISAVLVINDDRYMPMTRFNCVIKDLDAYKALLKYMSEKIKERVYSLIINYSKQNI